MIVHRALRSCAALCFLAPLLLRAQPPARGAPAATDTVVRAVTAPRTPLPSESATRAVSRFSFIAYGDARGRRDGEALQHEHWLVVESMVRTIAAMANGPDPVRFVLFSGDAVVNGRIAKQWNVSFVDNVNRITAEAGVPFFPAPGNHDVGGSNDVRNPLRLEGLRNYLKAFGSVIPANGSTRRLPDYPSYAFGYGNTFVIAWDSNVADDSTQYEWIRAQLESLDRGRYPNVVVFSHHAAYSSGPHGGAIVEAPSAVIRARYMPLFRKHHVRLYLAGHEHLFEHWVERYQDAAGRQYRLDEIVTGGGGARPPRSDDSGADDMREYIRLGAADKVSLEHLVKPSAEPGLNPYHYTVVHVDGEHIRVQVIGVDWGSGFKPYRTGLTDLGPMPVPP